MEREREKKAREQKKVPCSRLAALGLVTTLHCQGAVLGSHTETLTH